MSVAKAEVEAIKPSEQSHVVKKIRLVNHEDAAWMKELEEDVRIYEYTSAANPLMSQV
jgi:hypothetical protein